MVKLNKQLNDYDFLLLCENVDLLNYCMCCEYQEWLFEDKEHYTLWTSNKPYHDKKKLGSLMIIAEIKTKSVLKSSIFLIKKNMHIPLK